MYTKEQAEHALMMKYFDEIDKKLAYNRHLWAVDNQAVYNLPYRVLLDYKSNDDEVYINPYYPLPGIPVDYQWHPYKDGGYTENEWFNMIMQPTGETKNGKQVVTLKWPAAVEEQKAIKAKPCKQWDLETEQGRQAWLYWFGCFLVPAADRIPKYKCFDMWGTTDHTQQELKERIRYYMDLIKQCLDNPTIYKHEPQLNVFDEDSTLDEMLSKLEKPCTNSGLYAV